MSGSADAVEKIEVPQPEDGSEANQQADKITEFVDLASYNWLDETNPTILVPGVPPIWSPPGITPQLSPDSGTMYVDQNTDRNPWSPLEPLVRAVSIMHPDFKFDMIDVITDRRPIRKLFGFVAGETEDFEFGVRFMGNTALFTRMETETRQTFPAGKFVGYRRSFEEEYTKLSASAKGSTSHHRVIQYQFGGRRLLVRSSVDAYLDDLAKLHEVPSAGSNRVEEPDSDELVKYLNATSLESKAPSKTENPEAVGVKFIQGGKHIPYSSLLELRTRAKFAKRSFDIDQKLPDLWISQTPNFIEAAHQDVTPKWLRHSKSLPRRAEFTEIRVKSMKTELDEWEVRNATTLRKLSSVIKQVVDTVKAMNAPCIVRFRSYETGLLVFRAEEGEIPSLPDDLCGNWKNVEELELSAAS